ncbi:hypothetical protein TrVE_jg12941 [Triparma verrucosa]|uniref:Prenylcysteine lyase domain-containing protein n=1 Tax=Triparma verrucosa TaxID=1606542 RepID=A0A9W7BR36_9STRA|nr:hypothetical protein TrVE_jg12941 [Triparma verrucosa]
MAGRLITTSKKSYTPWNPAVRLRVERDIESARVNEEKKKQDDADQVLNALRRGSELAEVPSSAVDADLTRPGDPFTLFPEGSGKKRPRNELDSQSNVKHPKTGKAREGVSILHEPARAFKPEVNNKEAYDRREEGRKLSSDPAAMFMKVKDRKPKETLEERARREHDAEKAKKKEQKREKKKEKKREKKEMKRLKKERGSFKLDRSPTHTALVLQTILILTVLLLLNPSLASAQQSHRPQKIAIIGSGVGGTYVSQFLSESDVSFETTIFDSQSTVGGRVKSIDVTFDNQVATVELGASIAYGGNQYIHTYASKLNLDKITPSEDNPKNTFGIYDPATDSFVFRQSKTLPESWYFPKYLPKFANSFLLSAYRKIEIFLLYRNTLNPLFAYVKEAASRLDDLYPKLNSGATFSDCVQVWESINLSKYLTSSFSDFYKASVSSEDLRLLTQLSTAVNRVNYNHATETLPTLVSLISHVPIVYGDLFAVSGGNARLLSKLAESSNSLQLNTKVGLIVYNPQSWTFNVYSDSGSLLGGFDAVVMATPFQQAGGLEFKIQSMVDPSVLMPLYFDNGGEFEDVEESTVTMTKKEFHNSRTNTDYITTVTTVIEASRVKIEEFGGQGEVPESIYFASSKDTTELYGESGIFSVTQLKVSEDSGTRLFKIFSQRVLNEVEVKRIFEGGKILAAHAWDSGTAAVTPDNPTSTFNGGAYPHFGPTLEEQPPPTAFKIFADGIFYPTAFESTGSAMELAAIGAKVVANMIIEEAIELERISNRDKNPDASYQEL